MWWLKLKNKRCSSDTTTKWRAGNKPVGGEETGGRAQVQLYPGGRHLLLLLLYLWAATGGVSIAMLVFRCFVLHFLYINLSFLQCTPWACLTDTIKGWPHLCVHLQPTNRDQVKDVYLKKNLLWNQWINIRLAYIVLAAHKHDSGP